MDNKELLQEVETAIRVILAGGQSYKIGSRSVTRADLADLKELRKELQSETASAQSGLLGGFYVAEFDGR